jgi:outer membrane biosynthesis protein TonB
MISEDEAFWAGIAVATMMLGGGFSMLFLRALTGEGAVVLALGLMTMALTIQLRAKPRRYIEPWSPFDNRALNPTPPVESPTESQQTHIADFTQEPSQPQEETSQPAEQPQPEPTQPQQPEQVQEPPAQPETPTEQKKPEPQAPEKPQEEPIVVF